MKKRVYWIGAILVLFICYIVILNACPAIKNGVLVCCGGLWVWRGVAVGFLKIKGVYNLELTRKREIILAIIDGILGLSWVAIALLAGSKELQISLILLCAVPAILATAIVSYYKSENEN